LMGNAWLLVGGFVWAVFAAFQKRLIQKHGWKPQELNLIIYALSTVLLAPMANFSELLEFNAYQMFILFLLGLNTLLAYGAFAEANKLAPASYVSLIISCNPLLTIAILKILENMGSNIVSPEPILWRGYLGAALVVAGVSIAVSFKKKTRPPPTPA
ncbi:MAG: EamA family transporter, partial [Bdellovibrionota bacterium]